MVLLSAQSIDIFWVGPVHVIFFLMPLFYWVIYKPAVLPLWFIFLAGLVIDFSVDGLLGLHAFAFILYAMALYRLRRIVLSQPILFQFLVFIASAVIFESLKWFLICILTFQLWSFFPPLTAIFINIVAFWPILLVLKGLHRIVSGHGGL